MPSLPPLPVLNLKYEDVLAAPHEVVNTIGCTFSLARTTDTFRNYERSTKGEKDKDTEYYREYYLRE